MTQDDLKELRDIALATGAGAVDETAFGLPSKYIDAFKRLKQESPNAYTVGQVGSYFIPGTGVVEGGKLLGKGLGLGLKGAQEASALRKILGAAAAGATEGGGQAAIRKVLGTGNSDIESEALTGGATGAALGAASPLIERMAKGIYSHPKIFNPKSEHAEGLMSKLMDKGIWGGKGSFQKAADEAKGNYAKITGPYNDRIKNQSFPLSDVLSGLEGRLADKNAVGSKTDAKQLNETARGAIFALGPNPTFSDILGHRKLMNQELAALAPRKRMAAIAGGGEKLAAKDQAYGAMKTSINDLEAKAYKDNFGDQGVNDLAKAKTEYGTGSELSRALERTPPAGFKLPIGAGLGVGALETMAHGVGIGPMLGGAAAAGAAYGAKSLPARTGVGLLLNKVAKSPSGTAAMLARTKERIDRDEPAYILNDQGATETDTGRKLREGEDPFSDLVKPSPKSAPKLPSNQNRLIKQDAKDPFADIMESQ